MLPKGFEYWSYGEVAQAYDPQSGGGNTITVFDPRRRARSRAGRCRGTNTQCAGGRTPRESWLTREETVDVFGQPHGFVFEVPRCSRCRTGRARTSSRARPSAPRSTWSGWTSTCRRRIRSSGVAASWDEFTGATFSADGKRLFVNIQTPGIGYAITGPFDRGPLGDSRGWQLARWNS